MDGNGKLESLDEGEKKKKNIFKMRGQVSPQLGP